MRRKKIRSIYENNLLQSYKPTRTKRTEENNYDILETGKKTHESQLT